MAGLRVPLLLTLAIAPSLAALKWLPTPYPWIALVWVATCLLAMRTAATTAMRVLSFNLAVIALTLGGFEVWAGVNLPRRSEKQIFTPATYQQPDEVLGHTTTPGMVAKSQKWYGKTLLYDVTYSFDTDGLRVSPPRGDGPPNACVLFFGDSFTFGEGLNDTETLPYRVGAIGGGRFEVYNFGFHGYGPHQMLSALEHGRVASVLKCRPTHVIYTAIPDHVGRVSALNTWGFHDPRYRLEPDGSVRYDGHFDDEKPARPSRFRGEVRWQAGKSALYRWITARQRRATEQDMRLFVGVLSQARRFVESAYPGSVFEILFWEKRIQANNAASALQAAGFAPRIVERVLPSYHEDSASYRIPHDGHPTAKANDLLARYVVRSIIEGPHRP